MPVMATAQNAEPMPEIRASAALVWRDDRVLAAHRITSATGAGWEFAGGKREKDETGEQALRREMLEELGVRLSTVWLFDTVTYDYPAFRLVMDCYVCTLAPGEEPRATEHDELRWLSRDQLLSVDWLPIDRLVAERLGMFWDQAFASMHL